MDKDYISGMASSRKSKKVKIFHGSLTHKEDINVRLKSDPKMCDISGCVLLSPSKLLLADFKNKKLKVVDTQTKTVTEEKTLDSGPYDITLLPEHQIAVTMPDKKEIAIMTTAGELSTVNRIPVNRQCRGITYNEDRLYLACQKPDSVLVIDMEGDVKTTVPGKTLKSKGVSFPNYTALSLDKTLIYVCSYRSNIVASITLQGEITAAYEHIKLSRPMGMLVLDDGSLLTCSRDNGTIQRISADLKQGEMAIEELRDPKSMCCSRDKSVIYVGGEDYDQIKVSSLRG